VAAIDLPAARPDDPVVLRPLRESDAPRYAAAFREDPDLGRFVGVEQDPSEDRVREQIERAEEGRQTGSFVELAIADPATDAFLGSMVLHSFHRRHGRVEIGFWVVPAARRRGVVRHAIELTLRWVFDDLAMERVEMTTTPDNQPVKNLAAQLGFVHEGMFRERNLERGKRVDVELFGLLEREWRARGSPASG
jgi:[ribosomal protein S5]-alanine N-acetyltransferase